MKASIFGLILSTAILAGCANTEYTVLTGVKIRDTGFHGEGPTLTLRAEQPVTERLSCEYEHVSHIFVGPPFGPASEEDSLDQVSCGFSFGL